MSNTIAHNTAKEIVYALSKKYGFDTNEAWEYATNVTEVKNAMGETTSPSDGSDTGSSSDLGKKIATCKKNIDLWQKKLDDGKVADHDKQAEKIEKEKKKLEKLEASEPKTKGKSAPKKAEPKVEAKDTESDSSASNDSKIATCKKNIELWQKKLDEGKVKDADKQAEKIEKEKKKLQKLEDAEPKEKKAPVKEKPAEKEKRIKRFSPVMTSQLKAILAEVDIEITDKLKKEFQQYIEDLTDDDFKKDGFADHMRAFSKVKAPKKEVVPEKEDETADTTDGAPAADPDEDVDEILFEGKKYVVGEKTGRVYEAHDSGDVFKGFIGVGAFKTMTR